MAVFCIDTATGQVATRKQLLEAGIARPDRPVPRPWHEIQGTSDATTMWYAVMRRRERGIFIGALVLRHQGHHALLLERGWEEVPVPEIGVRTSPARSSAPGRAGESPASASAAG
jgi:hypothetical protein